MDAVVLVHVALQVLVWGVLFPIGMVLGLTKSRWHVPLQSAGYLLTIAGYIIGATRSGHDYPSASQGPFAYFLLGPILLQLILGLYLQFRPNSPSIRPYILKVHGIIGRVYPLLAWIQLLANFATLGGFCKPDDLTQCLAHYSMGSLFMIYGVLMGIMLLGGENWIRRSRRSPDFYESCAITAIGTFNTLFMHEEKWDIHDKQHTAMGIMLLGGGILGLLLTRKNKKRSVIPSVVMIVLGWSVSEHAQHLELATKVHEMFGKSLMLAGLARLIEVCYFAPRFKPPPAPEPLEDDASSEHTLAESHTSIATKIVNDNEDDEKASRQAAAESWKHLPPFLQIAAGWLLITATDAEVELAVSYELDHVTYILVMFAIAFLIYAFEVYLVHLYKTTGRRRDTSCSSSITPPRLPSPLSALRATGLRGALELQMSPASDSGPTNWRIWASSSRRNSEGGERVPLHVVGVDEEEDVERGGRQGASRVYSRV